MYCWHTQESVTTTSPVVSPPQVIEPESSEIRYRQTASVVEASEPPVQVADASQVAAAPQPHDIDVAGTETTERLQQQEDGDGSARLLEILMCTLNWENDTRRDPIIIVVIITLLFL